MAWPSCGLVWKPTSSGTPAARQRTRSSVQDLGRYRSRSTSATPPGAAYARNTPTWQVSCLPTVPVYWRWTPAERSPFLPKARLIQHQHRIGITQLLHDIVADAAGVPPRAIQQPLHPIRGLLTCLFGQPPAVLALDLAQQPSQVGQRPPARLHPPEPPTDALVQLDQPVRPHPDLFLGLLDLVARPRRAPRCLRHAAPFP